VPFELVRRKQILESRALFTAFAQGDPDRPEPYTGGISGVWWNRTATIFRAAAGNSLEAVAQGKDVVRAVTGVYNGAALQSFSRKIIGSPASHTAIYCLTVGSFSPWRRFQPSRAGTKPHHHYLAVRQFYRVPTPQTWRMPLYKGNCPQTVLAGGYLAPKGHASGYPSLRTPLRPVRAHIEGTTGKLGTPPASRLRRPTRILFYHPRRVRLIRRFVAGAAFKSTSIIFLPKIDTTICALSAVWLVQNDQDIRAERSFDRTYDHRQCAELRIML